MNLYLPGLESEARDIKLSQWFTGPELAELTWRWARRSDLLPDMELRVLEPAAGQGALLKPALRSPFVARAVAVEIDARHIPALNELAAKHEQLAVIHHDFLSMCVPQGMAFDLALQNPAYEYDQDVEFILRSLLWAPVTVGIFRSALLHGVKRFERLWTWVDPVRGVWLSERPQFGKSEKSDGPISDFVVLELVKRLTPRAKHEPVNVRMEWW